MGIHQQGLLGAFSGKVGPVVGSTWKGKNVLRARSRKPRNKNQNVSEKILAQRARFSFANKFLRSMSELFSSAFPEYSASITSRNAAMSAIIREAVTGTYPDFSINYSAVKIARGTVAKAYNPELDTTEPDLLKFSWLNNSGIGTGSKEDDKAILAIYCPEMDVCVFTINGAQRIAGEGSLNVKFFKGKTVHAWIAFADATGEKTSDSLYLGVVTLPA